MNNATTHPFMYPVRIIPGDCIAGMRTLPAGCVQCCVTSPPYWGLRDYGCDGQIGLESTPDEYVAQMVAVFAEVRRVLRDDGVVFLNIGDSYASSGRSDRKESPGVGAKQEMDAPGRSLQWEAGGGHNFSWYIPTSDGRIKPKDLCMIPWRVALALQADGWWVRSVIVWAKKSPMPESVTDRPTSSWEPIFLLSKSATYYYDAEAVKEVAINAGNVVGDGHKYSSAETVPGEGKQNLDKLGATPLAMNRNQRNVWHLGPEPYAEAHFATFPTEIPLRGIKAGTSAHGCCPTCRAPWRRITTREKVTRERPNDYTKRNGEDGTGNSCANSVAGVAVRTLGWEPTCKCPDHQPVPCLVLDPFSGSGTTGAVARQLGRYYVGCELNPEYIRMSEDRIGKAERPETYRKRAEAGGEPSLFHPEFVGRHEVAPKFSTVSPHPTPRVDGGAEV